MDITFLGLSSFRIKTPTATLVTDPFDPGVAGIPFPPVAADIVTISGAGPLRAHRGALQGDPMCFDWPGEFERGGIRIRAFQAASVDNMVFRITAGDITLLHCGNPGAMVDESILSAIGEIDVLCVPVGGGDVTTPEQAARIVKKVDPSVVIPMQYGSASDQGGLFAALAPVDAFLKEMGQMDAERTHRLKLTRDVLAVGEARVVVVERVGGGLNNY